MATEATAGEIAQVRARLIEHLDSTRLLLDALEPDRIDDDLRASIRQVHESAGAALTDPR